MAKSLEHILQHSGRWTVPVPPEYPRVDDPMWEKAFDDGNAEQKKNIASCWLWQLEESFSENCGVNFRRNRIASLCRVLAKFQKYADEQTFCGDPANLDTGYARQFISTRVKGSTELIALINVAWFSTGKAQRDAFNAFAKLMGELGPGPRKARYDSPDDPYESMLILGQAVGWSLPDLLDDTTLGNAIDLSIRCGLKELYVEGMVKKPPASGWVGLATFAGGNPYSDHVFQIVNSLAKTPPALALEKLLPLLKRVTLGARSEGETGLQQQNCFTINGVRGITPVYALLESWFPQFKHYWDTVALLGLDYEEACTALLADPAAFSSKTQKVVAPSLPTSELT